MHTCIAASLHTHIHTYKANETGNYPAERRFMCVDLSLAIKIRLIFFIPGWLSTAGFLYRSPTHFLQPLSLTFSPAHKTPAALLFLHPCQLHSSFPFPSLLSLLLYLSIYSDLRYDSIYIGCVCVSPLPVLALFFSLSLPYCTTTLSGTELFCLNCLFSSSMIDLSHLSDSWRIRTVLQLILNHPEVSKRWALMMSFRWDIQEKKKNLSLDFRGWRLILM